jgi:outer membrane protein OmpA-like peptidoglycan-associated protein
MKALTMTAGAVIACMIAGCASKPPTELKNARAAYTDAAQSPAASVAQADVYEAKKSLDKAEMSFNEDGDSAETRDLAYIATRKAEIAKARGNTALSMQAKQMAMQDAQRWREQQATATRQQLGQTKEQLERSQQQLESERQARVAAEQRTTDALTRIKGMTAKQEQRGLVLTLSGSVLFASGKSELLPGAQKRLDDVVAALKDDPRSITIVGHTDSVGSEDKNQQLSQKRADAVRQYLTTHGVPENRVTSEGMGEKEPIASNKTAEGRANNRRVEIILNAQPGGGQQQQPGMQQPGGTSSTQGGQQQPGMQSPSGSSDQSSTTTTTGGTMQAPSTGTQQQGQQPHHMMTPEQHKQHMQQMQQERDQKKQQNK